MTQTVERLTVGLKTAQLKAEADVKTGERTIQYYAAAFTEEQDSAGHVVAKDAFDEWLPGFYTAGRAHAISFNHSAVLDPTDPTNVIGYASADPEHIWVDDYGLAVKGTLNTTTEKGKAVEWQIEHGLLKGASLAMMFDMTNTDRRKDGALVIKKVDRVFESGLVPNPANQAAVLMWMKSEGMTEQQVAEPYMTVSEFEAVLKSNPTNVQSWHDALVEQGAVCVEKDEALTEEEASALTKAEEVLEASSPLLSDEDREAQRRFRYLEITQAPR